MPFFSLPGASDVGPCATPDCKTPLGCRWSWKEQSWRPPYCAACWANWASADGSLAGAVLAKLLPGEAPVCLPLGELITPGKLEEVDLRPTAEAPKLQTKIEVTPEDTLHATSRLKDIEPTDAPMAVLNMANAEHIGGAFLRDVTGQEEELCRRTSIYPRLANNRQNGLYPLPEISVLLDKEVRVLRRDKSNGYSELDESQTFTIDVVTGAAPSHPWLDTPEQLEAYRSLMGKKIYNLLKACKAAGYKKLVLSAWGCGAFRNPPKEVAQLFKSALQTEFSGCFDHVVFAIFDRPDWPETNYAVFKSVFEEDGAR